MWPVSGRLFECFTLDRREGSALILLRMEASRKRAAKSPEGVYLRERSGTLSAGRQHSGDTGLGTQAVPPTR